MTNVLKLLFMSQKIRFEDGILHYKKHGFLKKNIKKQKISAQKKKSQLHSTSPGPPSEEGQTPRITPWSQLSAPVQVARGCSHYCMLYLSSSPPKYFAKLLCCLLARARRRHARAGEPSVALLKLENRELHGDSGTATRPRASRRFSAISRLYSSISSR